jgi:hypothetical protein
MAVWAGDGVHLTSRCLMMDVAKGSAMNEQTNKRVWLESVIPAPAAPLAKTPHQPMALQAAPKPGPIPI